MSDEFGQQFAERSIAEQIEEHLARPSTDSLLQLAARMAEELRSDLAARIDKLLDEQREARNDFICTQRAPWKECIDTLRPLLRAAVLGETP